MAACIKTSMSPSTYFVLFVFSALVLMCDQRGFVCADKHRDAVKKYTEQEEQQPMETIQTVPGVTGKTRELIDKTLKLNKHEKSRNISAAKENIMRETVQELADIYKSTIKPLEDVYRFGDLNKDALLEAEILAKPLILLVGPWSTGKTSLINYLLGVEESPLKLRTGAEPTTSDFYIIQHGAKYRTVKGMQLVTDKSKAFSSLEKFGQAFIEKLQGVEMISALLELVTIVDTPGIIENKKQQERGYPFSEVMQWFLQRASIIFLIFDPTKLEVGSELESIFNQLKGYEGKVKILLNKADTIHQQELMRVYGTLFWSLAPLVHSVEPPRVYVGSFWSQAKLDHPMAKLFLDEELSLLNDLDQAIENQVENKIAYVRRHAWMVRLHALTVDSFIQTFEAQKGFWTDNERVWEDIVLHPGKFGVFQNLLRHTDISKHDLPKTETYIDFFSINQVQSFSPLRNHCSFFYGCLESKIDEAVTHTIPGLLHTLQSQTKTDYCTKDSCNI